MELNTFARPFKKALSTNSTASSFASKIATVTEPTNDGVLDLTAGGTAGPGGFVPVRMFLLPYGLGSSNDGFSMRVIGWRHIGAGPPQGIWLWVPVILGEFACLLGAMTGVATAPVLNTECFCDTITPVAARLPDRVIAAGTAVNSDTAVSDPANDTSAYIDMLLRGVEKVEFTFDQTTNTPTMNTLVSFY